MSCTMDRLAERLARYRTENGNAFDELVWLYKEFYGASGIVEELNELGIEPPCEPEEIEALEKGIEEEGEYIVLEAFGGAYMPLMTEEGQALVFRSEADAEQYARTNAQEGVVVKVG